MRVVVNARFLIKDKLEGIGWFSYEVLTRMVLAHPEVEFIFLFDRPFDSSFIFADNVKGVRLSPPARHPFLWYVWFEWAVARYVKKASADVFFSPDGFLSLRSKLPQVVVCHDIAFEHFPQYVPGLVKRYYKYFTPKYVQSAHQVVTVSNFVKQDIVQYYGIDASKITVANNAARAAFKPMSQSARDAFKAKHTHGEDYFIYVGAIHPRKNVELIIQAFEQYKLKTKSTIKLVLLGRLAWQTDTFERQLAHSPVRQDIILPGYCTTDQLVQYTAGAQAMIYVSKSEGFGIPLLEAMQCGVPLIVSDQTSLPEVAGDAALICPVDDNDQLAVYMEAIMLDEDLRADLIQKGYKRVKHYTWDRAAKVCFDAIEKAAHSN